jgi:NADH dehydrogenase FAD-containing subunit
MSEDRVLVIGGNMAGLSAARNIGRDKAVTVVNPSPWCEWLPNIHELISGQKQPDALRLPLAEVLERCGHRFIQDRVLQLDPAAGKARLAGGREIEFDVCIVATGGQNNDAGVPGVHDHALPFKCVEDCYRIRQRLKKLVAEGERHGVTIVGGGLEGVEALGEILRGFGRHRSALDIHLVDPAPRLLPDTPEKVHRSIRAACRDYSVKFHHRSLVTAVEAETVVLDDGRRLPSALTIWTGGVTPGPDLHRWGLTEQAGQWAPVSATLLSRFHDNVLVIGDAADTGQALSKQAYHAMQMGDLAGQNVEALLAGRPLKPFEPAPKPQLITFGHLDCFLLFDRMVVAGMVLAQLKEAIYQVNMARLNPPSRLSPALAFYQRLYKGFWRSLWPNVTNLSSLLKLPQLRVYGAETGGEETRQHEQA